MRNLITIFIILTSTLNCRAQTIIPLENFKDFNQDLSDNAYVKDTNNNLEIFESDWRGSHNGNDYFLRFRNIYLP